MELASFPCIVYPQRVTTNPGSDPLRATWRTLRLRTAMSIWLGDADMQACASYIILRASSLEWKDLLPRHSHWEGGEEGSCYPSDEMMLNSLPSTEGNLEKASSVFGRMPLSHCEDLSVRETSSATLT
eukprot:761398-Hanusia_phi.AAC.2